MARITIRETTVSGEVLNTYVAHRTPDAVVQDPTSSAGSSRNGRIDIVSSTPSASDGPTSSLRSAWARKLLEPFLPVGYPDSVSPDYTAYQSKLTTFRIAYLTPSSPTHLCSRTELPELTCPTPVFDSLQALFSSTTSLLASRAVLQTLGVGSSTATTTFAMYLSIAQTTLSNLTSILFAHRFSASISQHVKFYRFFADIVNDLAFVLDVLSPSLPDWGRVPSLCAASCCRALCGVTGGASKAVLSGHFAKEGNVGELAAKDGSQEVLVGLVGMWAGGVVVGRIEGEVMTWTMLMLLLAGHLWCNWKAVASVRLRTLGGERTASVVEGLMRNDAHAVTIEEVGRRERILLGWRNGGSEFELRSDNGSLGVCCFGGIADLLACAGWLSQASGRAYVGDVSTLEALFEVFKDENYLLWWHGAGGERRFVVVMKTGGSDVACQLKAMCHAWRIASGLSQGNEKAVAPIDFVRNSLATTSEHWPRSLSMVRAGGWDLEASRLAAESEKRIEASISAD